MTLTPAFGALLGVGVGLGLWLIIRGWSNPPNQRRRPRRQRATDRGLVLRLLGCAVVAALAGVLSGWVVGALLAGIAAWWLPRLLGPDRQATARVARFEAIASWAEMLRDTLSAAAGLEQAILVTAPLVPDAIRAPVTAAANRLQAGQRLAPVLRDLADEVADPTADLVMSALVMAAEQRARDLGELLGSLAKAARDHAALRMNVSASRAQARSEVRITVGVTVTFALGLLLLDRHYLTAYDSAAGQLTLLVVGALFAAGLALTQRFGRITEPERFLTLTSAAATGTGDTAHRQTQVPS